MRHTLKLSLFIGVCIAGVILLLFKIFQPISYFHLIIFAYAFVLTSVIAGIVTHKNLIKRKVEKLSNDFLLHKGKNAVLHTKNGEIHKGRFQNLDNQHIVLDYVVDLNNNKTKSVLMIPKEEIKKLEIE